METGITEFAELLGWKEELLNLASSEESKFQNK